jgi:hypothetical protein
MSIASARIAAVSTALGLLALIAGPAMRSAAAPAQAAVAGPWRDLSAGAGIDAWRGWISGVLPAGWHVADGVLSKTGAVEDLLTREEFGNFELELQWKIGRDGNSGVFYRGTRGYDHIYWSAPEYQLLDDANAPDGRSPLTSSGAAYGVYPAPRGVVKPLGEWNTTRIRVVGAHVEHWLNGRKVVDYQLGGADWKIRVAASKFARYPNYGLAPRGFIGIQGDHPGTLALRGIRIRTLP